MPSPLVYPNAIPSFRHFSPYALPFYQNSMGVHAPMTTLGQKKKEKVELIWPWEQQGETMPDFLCLMFHGRRGRGKSTGMTAFAKYMYDTNRRLDPEYKVYSNYRVNFADMAHPRLVDALITFPPWLRKCMVLIDEIAVYFPSTRATSTNALNFATFLQEIRKLEVDMIFTTQFPTMIIGNASVQIDLFIEPYLYNHVYDWKTDRMVGNSVMMNNVDWWGQWTGYPVSHRWPPNEKDIIASPSLHNLYYSGLYDEFNTKEVIPAFWHPGRTQVIQREWEEEWKEEEMRDAAQAEKEAQAVRRKAPSTDNASTLTELLAAQKETSFRLSGILRSAQRIDPQIRTFAHLATALRSLGWSCFQQGGKYGEWWAEKLA